MKTEDRNRKIVQRYTEGQVTILAIDFDLSERQVRRILTEAGMIRSRAETNGSSQFNVKLKTADLDTLRRKARGRNMGLSPYVVRAGLEWRGGVPKKS